MGISGDHIKTSNKRAGVNENLRVNSSKTMLISFTRKSIPPNLNYIKLFEGTLPSVNKVKYLGLLLDTKLIWRYKIQT